MTSGNSRGVTPRGGGINRQNTIPPSRVLLFFLILLVANYLITSLFMPGPDDPVPISYTTFRAQLAQDNVEAVHSQGVDIEGRFKNCL